MSETREMTLKEWMGQLPTCHLARKEFDELLATERQLRERAEADAAVMRAALQLAYDAMNYMGDIANEMDIVERKDIERTSPAFCAARSALTSTAGAELLDRLRKAEERPDLTVALEIANRSADEQMWLKRKAEAERDTLRAEVAKLREDTALQLAACDCAAMMDTESTHAQNKDVTSDNPAWSAAFDSVMRRTAECIKLRAEVERLREELARKEQP